MRGSAPALPATTTSQAWKGEKEKERKSQHNPSGILVVVEGKE
jgi:hypothetical protein